jgi:choline transport protein
MCADMLGSYRRALAFEAVLFVFMFFPVAPNPDVPNFNWTTLVFGVVVIWAIAYYHLWGKRKYSGPVAYVKRQDM